MGFKQKFLFWKSLKSPWFKNSFGFEPKRSVNFARTFCYSRILPKKQTRQFNHSTVRKNLIRLLVFWKDCRLETLRHYLTFRPANRKYIPAVYSLHTYYLVSGLLLEDILISFRVLLTWKLQKNQCKMVLIASLMTYYCIDKIGD